MIRDPLISRFDNDDKATISFRTENKPIKFESKNSWYITCTDTKKRRGGCGGGREEDKDVATSSGFPKMTIFVS